MPTYEPASAEVLRLVEQTVQRYHGALEEHGVTFKVLMVGPTTNENGDSQGPPLKVKGYPCCAIIKVTSTRDRAAGMADVLLQIDEDRWDAFHDERREALIDHELAHLEVNRDKDGQVVYDDRGRPRLRIKPHDREVSWFDEVVRRHGRDAVEWVQFDNLCGACQQLELPFMESVG